MERVRNAVADCVMCGADPGWHEAVRSWEALDRTAHGYLHDIERRSHPDNWPIAGNAAETGANLTTSPRSGARPRSMPSARSSSGATLHRRRTHRGAARAARESDTITLHLRPELTLAQVKGILADAKKSGASKVAVVARAPEYPWERRFYWLSDAGKTRVGLRPTDSLQLLLHTIDHVASPGAVARVD